MPQRSEANSPLAHEYMMLPRDIGLGPPTSIDSIQEVLCKATKSLEDSVSRTNFFFGEKKMFFFVPMFLPVKATN